MFERFTEPARQVVVLAQDEARNLKHKDIGTEHLLLGLLREGEGIAFRTLAQLGLELSEVRDDVARIVGLGDTVPARQIPFTPRAKHVLELSLRAALEIGHHYVGTEHLLLGLARENQGVAVRLLGERGITADAVREEVVVMLGGRRVVRIPPHGSAGPPGPDHSG